MGELEMTVPGAVVGLTLTTSGKLDVVPLVKLPPFPVKVHVTVPAEPTGGVIQVQFAGVARDTKVAPVGMTSVKVTPVAVAGPLFVTVWV